MVRLPRPSVPPAVSTAREVARELEQDMPGDRAVVLGGHRLATVLAGPPGGLVVIVVERSRHGCSYGITRFDGATAAESHHARTRQRTVRIAVALLRRRDTTTPALSPAHA